MSVASRNISNRRTEFDGATAAVRGGYLRRTVRFAGAPLSSRLQRLAPLSVIAAGGAVAATLLGDSMLYAVMPSSPGAWGLSVAAVGVLLSANRLVRLLSNPLAAVIFSRLGTRIPFGAAIAVAVVVTASYGWMTAFWALLLARVTWGVCWSMLRMGGEWTVLDEATDENRGLLIGSYSAIVRTGGLGGALLGGLLTDAIGHRATLSIFAVAIAAAGVAWLAAIRRLPTLPPPPTQVTGLAAGFADVLRDRRLLMVSVSGLLVGLVFAGLVGASIGFFLREQFGERITLGGLAIGVTSFAGITLASRSVANIGVGPLAGHLSDRIGRVRGTVGGLLIAAVGVALLGLATSIWVFIAAVLIAFIASGATMVQLTAAAGDMAPPARRATVLSTYATFLDLGAAIGPLLGLSFGSLTTLRAMFLASAVALAVLALVFRATMSGRPTIEAATVGESTGG